MAIKLCILLFTILCLNAQELLEDKTDPDILEDASLDTFTLIRKYNFPCEIHRVYTEDGYILEMHRIPHAPNNAGVKKRPVVFLQHGLLSSSAEWVLMRPGRGLAYILAESGYDVWMGNARGNTYSRKHISLKTTSSSFWKFSWHEIGFYDLPAMIDYVLKETGISKIQYIGFSQGTTAFWVMSSTRPEYNEKILAMQALAPIAFIGGIRSPLIKALGPFTNSLETMLPVVLGHTPAGASTRQVIHFGQNYQSKRFLKFDYGWWTNKRVYGTLSPPPYNLSAITTPIFLHYGDNDWLSTPKDVDKLLSEVPSVVGKFRVPLAKFNHLDFVFANDAKALIYDRLLKIMEQFL